MQIRSTAVSRKTSRLHEPSSRLAQGIRSELPFGEKLRTIREEKGIGLRELAARVGISPSYLSNIETGKFAPPAEDKLRAIARELELDPNQLLVVPGNHDPECGSGQLFGTALRCLREQKGIGLGELAIRVGMSAPYLCNIELGKFPPPSEAKLCAIAHDLGHNSDELLAKAGKTASDLSIIINRYPRQFAAILRSLRGLEESDFLVLINGLAKQFNADIVVDEPPLAKKEGRKELRRNVHPPIDWKLLGETFGVDSQAREERNEGDVARIPLRQNKSKESAFWDKSRDRLRSAEASIDKEMVVGKRALENEGKKKARKPADGVLVRTSS
jgi:transcriptional regulator with XRE-family HTH domain